MESPSPSRNIYSYELLSSLTFHEQREFVGNDRLNKVIQVARVNTGVALCHLLEVQLISLEEKKDNSSLDVTFLTIKDQLNAIDLTRLELNQLGLT